MKNEHATVSGNLLKRNKVLRVFETLQYVGKVIEGMDRPAEEGSDPFHAIFEAGQLLCSYADSLLNKELDEINAWADLRIREKQAISVQDLRRIERQRLEQIKEVTDMLVGKSSDDIPF